jgi:hypothetical protein
MKKVFLSSVLASSILLFTACGNGGSTTASNTSTGYYVDSAVSGVEYICGNQKGITADDGSFKFEKGKDCTFKLGDIKLRDVKAENLVDNVKILEDCIEVAQMLQTLDTDGNPDNGITIKSEVITAMKMAGIHTLPKNDDEVGKMFDVIKSVSGYKGEFTSKAEAQTHLNKSYIQLTSATATLPTNVIDAKMEVRGKTYYVPVCNEYPHQEKLVFQTNGKLNKSWWNGMRFDKQEITDYSTTGDTINIKTYHENIMLKITEVGNNWLILTNDRGEKSKIYMQVASAYADLENGVCSYSLLLF